MIFRDGVVKFVRITYELVKGDSVVSENTVGILATDINDAMETLRKIIHNDYQIRVSTYGNSGHVHIISDNMVNAIQNKEKKEKTTDSTQKRGRKLGSKNKIKS
jgi:hypothetical protein